MPFRHAPGLSLLAPAGPPEQIGLFTDGGAPSAITPADADLRYLEAETAALPYHLVDRPRVLVLGAGGGAEVLRALHHGARAVDAVELNPDVLAIVRDVLAGAPGAAWEGERVRTHVADARSFAARSSEEWDLIQIALVDSFSAAAAGVHALDESLLYTVEARSRPSSTGSRRRACSPSRAGSSCRRAIRSSCSGPRGGRWRRGASPIPHRSSP